MNNITIKDIARLAGASVSTVSRAINNHPDINEATRELIMTIIRDNDYIPNNSARNLKRIDSKTVAVLIKGIDNPFFTKMIKVIESELKKRQYALAVQHVDSQEDEVDIAIQLVKERRLSGIIFLGGHFNQSSNKLRRLGVPYVTSTTGNSKGVGEAHPFVSVDDVNESERIVSYLCEKGHRNIAILCAYEDDTSVGALRLEGYRRSLKKNGIKYNPNLICRMNRGIEAYSMQNGYDTMLRLLDRGEYFSAVYAISDTLAIGACRAISERGLKVPNDISVAGFDGIDETYYYTPTICTIRQPFKEIARSSVMMLIDIINDNITSDGLVLQGELYEGESVGDIN